MALFVSSGKSPLPDPSKRDPEASCEALKASLLLTSDAIPPGGRVAAGHGSGRSVATHRVARAAAPKAHKRPGKSLAALGQSPLRELAIWFLRLCGGWGKAPVRPVFGPWLPLGLKSVRSARAGGERLAIRFWSGCRAYRVLVACLSVFAFRCFARARIGYLLGYYRKGIPLPPMRGYRCRL